MLLNVLVVDIIPDDTGNHTDDKRHNGCCHFEHLLSVRIDAVEERKIASAKVYQKIFSRSIFDKRLTV